ncbi:MAG TPA: GAP family protein [Microthrixaceae bacterium]|nr:GAP family protein [Microthrixaceae bacterium]
MTQGISEILGFAVGVAVSPFPIIAVILMLFTPRAKVNGPMFGLGWMISLALLSGVAYALADVGDAATSSGTADTIAWGKLVFGVLLLAGAARTWKRRPGPGDTPEMPKWMSSIDGLTPPKALALGLLLAGVNPKNLMLAIAAGTSLAQLGLTTGDAAISLVVFVLVASLTIVGPVAYYLVGGERAERTLDELKGWLGTHNDAVMAVLLLVFGVDLFAKGLGILA